VAIVQTKFDVPYTALNRQAATIKAELMAAVETVIDGGRYILGPHVAAFESEFAALCGTSYARGMSNGTSALHVTLRTLDLKAGDEVITAPNSFLASASTIALAGGRPVFADVRHDMNIDPERVEPALLDIARRRGLFVLEDAAQAVGATLEGKPVGGWGDAGSFSLHPLKNLHAYGDAGAVTTNDETLANRLSLARNHGLRNREVCEFWSFNSRLDELHAAMLRVQLRHLADWTAERRRIAHRYHRLLRPHVVVPEERPGEVHVYQTYMIQAEDRDVLQRHLVSHGVEALVHYATPIHLQPAARDLGYTDRDFPVCKHVVDRILSLPLYPGLTEAQQDRVAELIADFYRGR
jgi:dTDP-4-amino-4,6-dideoxygalactose transaminase